MSYTYKKKTIIAYYMPDIRISPFPGSGSGTLFKKMVLPRFWDNIF
jgi:hypothetical protein